MPSIKKSSFAAQIGLNRQSDFGRFQSRSKNEPSGLFSNLKAKQLNSALGDTLKFMGVTLNAKGVDSWVGSVFILLTGLGLFEVARRHFLIEWGDIQVEIEKEIKRRETA